MFMNCYERTNYYELPAEPTVTADTFINTFIFRFGAWLIKPITKFYEIEWILRNEKVLSEDRGAVIVSNHQSSLDILGKSR